MNIEEIKKSYLLYVGNAYPHKNLLSLIKAFQKIVEREPDLCLVLVGKMDHFYQRLAKLVEKSGIADKVVFAGRLSDQQLNQVYQQALAYVFPSLKEGFGLPGLEAMRAGVPVISSDQGSLPEIYGSAAIYFDPHDVDSMAEAILKVVQDRSLQEKLIEQGRQRVNQFSWEKCARQTKEIYEQNEQ